MLLRNQPDMLYSILIGMVLASLLLFVLGIFVAKQVFSSCNTSVSFSCNDYCYIGVVGSYSLKKNCDRRICHVCIPAL